MENNKYLILFAFRGSLQNMSFTTFVSCSWKGFFVASYLLLFCCFGVLKRAFFRSNLSLVPAFFGVAVFFVRALLIFGVSACVVFFLWVLICFLSILFVILDLSLLGCSVLMVLVLLHVLAARLSVGGFLGCLLTRTLLGGGRLKMADREGSIYFRFFFIIGVVG